MRPGNKRAYILVIPSLFTTGNLFCGYYAIVHAFSHQFEKAAYAIFLAGIFDVLDGRVARITRSTSEFGVEYDSIADVVSFGVAPATLVYVWVLEPFGRLGWAVSFFFMACGALRLARFNTIAEEMPKAYFLGLPIPAAAYSIAAAYIAFHDMALPYAPYVMLALTVFLGALMVSSIRYRSFKDFDLKHPRSFFLLVTIVILLTLIAVKPELGLPLVFVYYVIWGAVKELYGLLTKPRERKLGPQLLTTENSETGTQEGK